MRLGISAILLFVFVGLAAGQSLTRRELCSLFANERSSSGSEVVRIKAFMTMSTVGRVDGGESFFYSSRCNNSDNFVRANFSQLTDKRVDKFFRTLPKEKDFVLEVDVTGTLHTSLVPKFGHLNWSPSEFRISKVHSISDSTQRRGLIKPDHEAASPVSDLGNYLRDIDSIMTMHLLGDFGAPDLEGVLSPDFTVLDPAGKKYGRSELSRMAKDLLGEMRDQRAVTLHGVRVDGSVYTTNGTASVLDSAGVERKFTYENTFVLVDDSFVLLHSRFRNP